MGKSKSVSVGLVLLIFWILLGGLGPLLVPYPDAARHWRDIDYWRDSPSAVPPTWINGPWNKNKLPVSSVIRPTEVRTSARTDGGTTAFWTFPLLIALEPRDLILRIPGDGSLPLVVFLSGPSGEKTEIIRTVLNLSPSQEGRFSLLSALREHDFFHILEQSSKENAPQQLSLEVVAYLPSAPQGSPELIILGQVSGLLGTDVAKRDVFTGIVLGVRWALLLGVVVSFLTVLMGMILGIFAACYGGWIGSLINRIYEFFYLMPLLPFLIVVSSVYKPSLWSLMLLALLFFWTRAFKPVYAMALQIRQRLYVDVGRTLGASKFYLAFHYLLPDLLPYGFAVMALSVPSVILYESSISLLGLGDSMTITWGQMLHDALVQGAVVNRLWWWILPPGLMIAFMGLTFALLGRGLDKTLNPSVWSHNRR